MLLACTVPVSIRKASHRSKSSMESPTHDGPRGGHCIRVLMDRIAFVFSSNKKTLLLDLHHKVVNECKT